MNCSLFRLVDLLFSLVVFWVLFIVKSTIELFFWFFLPFREQWTPAILHREGGQRDVAATLAHLLQSARFATLQELRAACGEDDVRHRGNGRLRSRIKEKNKYQKMKSYGSEMFRVGR